MVFPGQENPLGWEPKGAGPMANRELCTKNIRRNCLGQLLSSDMNERGRIFTAEKPVGIAVSGYVPGLRHGYWSYQEGQDFHCCSL